MRNRLVPEDRIKTLHVVRKYNFDLIINKNTELDLMFNDAGMELAAKLREFKKYLIMEDGKYKRLILSIDIIVPKEPPKCPA